jgi:hypothetical protein
VHLILLKVRKARINSTVRRPQHHRNSKAQRKVGRGGLSFPYLLLCGFAALCDKKIRATATRGDADTQGALIL